MRAQPSATERSFVSVAEAAKMLGLHPDSLYRAISEKRLRAVRLREGGKLLIPLDAIRRIGEGS